jgi:hypothetical protein
MATVLVRPIPNRVKVTREEGQRLHLITGRLHKARARERTVHPQKVAERIVLGVGSRLSGLLKGDAIESDMTARHGIDTIHATIDDVTKSTTVLCIELHQGGHDSRCCAPLVIDIKRMAHVDVIPDPHMLVPALDVGTRDGGGRKQVRAEWSEPEGAVIFEEPSQASQGRRIITVRQVIRSFSFCITTGAFSNLRILRERSYDILIAIFQGGSRVGAEEKARSLRQVHLSDHRLKRGPLPSEESPVKNEGSRVLGRYKRHFTNDQDLTVFPYTRRRSAGRARTRSKRFWRFSQNQTLATKAPSKARAKTLPPTTTATIFQAVKRLFGSCPGANCLLIRLICRCTGTRNTTDKNVINQ